MNLTDPSVTCKDRMPDFITRSRYFINDMLGKYPYLVFGSVRLRYRVTAGAITWEAEAPVAVAGDWLDVPFETWESWTGGIFLHVSPADGSAEAALELLSRDDQALVDQDGKPWTGGVSRLSGMMVRFADPNEHGMAFRVRAATGELTSALNVGLGYVDHTQYGMGGNVAPFAPILDLRPPIRDTTTPPVGDPTPPKPSRPSMPKPAIGLPVHGMDSLPRDARTAGLQIEVLRMRNQVRLLRARDVAAPRAGLHVVTGVDR